MSEMQQSRKMEQPKVEPQQSPAERTRAEHLQRTDLTRQVPAGESRGAAMSGDAGDNNKRRNTDLNVSGGFDSAAGKQAVAEHLHQQEVKKPEAQATKQANDAARPTAEAKPQQEATKASDIRQQAQAEMAARAHEGAALRQRSGENAPARDMNRTEAANVARVAASDHNNRPREGMKTDAKTAEEPKKPTLKGA